jgi:anion-transporting  ArsA/GET3 family ATPase
VADKAAEAATLLLAENKRVAATAEKTNEKLDVIHILVNSNMTAAMQSELDATVREAAMMREVMRLNKSAGQAPTTAATDALAETDKRIAKLRAELHDRLKQTVVAEKVQAVDRRERKEDAAAAVAAVAAKLVDAKGGSEE